MSEQKTFLVMYDIRGIQNFIFRIPELNDAIGASAVVEDIIEKGIRHAVEEMGLTDRYDEKWFEENKPVAYKGMGEALIQILYIGGGNGYVMVKGEDTLHTMNRIFSRYVLEHTYSLQLVCAAVEKTDSYQKDYDNLQRVMSENKAKMIVSAPLGALPVTQVEVKSGLPITGKYEGRSVSLESRMKKEAGSQVREAYSHAMKILDHYVTEKGRDSTIAVIHMDGNNMGLRIRRLLEKEKKYEDAVTRMREISLNINTSFKKVMRDMADKFNSMAEADDGKFFVLPVLTAGDDVTYICNGQIAFQTVQDFTREITKKKLSTAGKDSSKYRFSLCAGIAFINSHFPFNIGYQVAEELCSDYAKKAAKDKKNMDKEEMGNWVDFAIVKNVQAQDIESVRDEEYRTVTGALLMKRPYFITTDSSAKSKVFSALMKSDRSLDNLLEEIVYFQSGPEKEACRLPRSQAKELRNTYPLGKAQVQQLEKFLNSRGRKLPDGTMEAFDENGTAKYFDALDMMDLYDPEIDKE